MRDLKMSVLDITISTSILLTLIITVISLYHKLITEHIERRIAEVKDYIDKQITALKYQIDKTNDKCNEVDEIKRIIYAEYVRSRMLKKQKSTSTES